MRCTIKKIIVDLFLRSIFTVLGVVRSLEGLLLSYLRTVPSLLLEENYVVLWYWYTQLPVSSLCRLQSLFCLLLLTPPLIRTVVSTYPLLTVRPFFVSFDWLFLFFIFSVSSRTVVSTYILFRVRWCHRTPYIIQFIVRWCVGMYYCYVR